jgi:hypothetical protein
MARAFLVALCGLAARVADDAVHTPPTDPGIEVPTSLLQLSALTGNAPLYTVNVNVDLDKLNPNGGATIVFDKDAYALRMDAGVTEADGLAWGHLAEKLGTTGWDELYIQTSQSARSTNDVRVYAAGFLEGILTAKRLSQFYSNFYQLIMKDEDNMRALANIKVMYAKEMEFVKTNSNIHPGALSVEPVDPYWKQIRYLLFQLWGMKDGYNAVALPKGVRMLDLVDMYLINNHGELSEEMEAYTPKMVDERKKAQGADLLQVGQLISKAHKQIAFLAPDIAKDDTDAAWEKRMRKSRCSAFVRLVDQSADLMVGHTTWDDYSKMTRIFKYYNFDLPGAWTKATHIAFSSYPGTLWSSDNFYILNSGLVIADTSLEILNPKVYDRIPEFPSNPKIPNFLHVMAVNRMAATGNHWTSLFSERNSGTGNAQWLVVDYNTFVPNEPLKDNTVWLVEQIPGITQEQDVSGILRNQGYFASYNRPYFGRIRDETGHSAAQARHGALYSFANSPRGQIFARIGVSVNTMFDLRNLMTRNSYPNEGTFPSAAGHAVSARMDLVGYSPIPNGGIDAKVTNRCLLRRMQAQCISGPTHSQQKEFAWTADGKDLWPGWPHLGLPDTWNFDWVQMTPTGTMDIHDISC